MIYNCKTLVRPSWINLFLLRKEKGMHQVLRHLVNSGRRRLMENQNIIKGVNKKWIKHVNKQQYKYICKRKLTQKNTIYDVKIKEENLQIHLASRTSARFPKHHLVKISNIL